MKYELILRDIYKHTERAGLVQELPSLQDAIYVMKVSLLSNDMSMLVLTSICYYGMHFHHEQNTFHFKIY